MKTMRKLAFVATTVILASSAFSCKNGPTPDQKLQAVADGYISSSPDKSCTYNNKTLTYRNVVDKSTLVRVRADELQAQTLSKLQQPSNQELVQDLINAGANVQYVYVDPAGTDSIVFTFTPSDLTPAKAE